MVVKLLSSQPRREVRGLLTGVLVTATPGIWGQSALYLGPQGRILGRPDWRQLVLKLEGDICSHRVATVSKSTLAKNVGPAPREQKATGPLTAACIKNYVGH